MEEKLLLHFQTKPKSIEERIAEGKALRDKFPRNEQVDYTEVAHDEE